MSERDHGGDQMLETIQVRVFPIDKERLEEIVKAKPEKYENVSHAARCALQEFIRKWGNI